MGGGGDFRLGWNHPINLKDRNIAEKEWEYFRVVLVWAWTKGGEADRLKRSGGFRCYDDAN